MHIRKTQDALEAMHKTIVETANNKRAAEVERHNQQTNVQPINFSTGDFVLIGCPQKTKSPKLSVTWTGPARVVKMNTPSTAHVEDLITRKVLEIHTTRLKFYHNQFLEVTEQLTDYLKYQQTTMYLVDELKQLTRVRRKGFKVLVSWVGFPGEDTWEPLADLCLLYTSPSPRDS